jgi:hypothetical protein
LMTLLDTPGPDARKAILGLAKDPVFNHFPDRLLLLERMRAARDAEGPAMTTEEVVVLEKSFEAPPNDRDSLFACMVGRLEDLAHDIAHDDFSDRRTLRTIKDESEMNARWLAGFGMRQERPTLSFVKTRWRTSSGRTFGLRPRAVTRRL